MKAIADEAHMLGIKVAAHAHGDEGIRTAILAGIDTIEHCSLASDEAIKLAIQHKTWFDMDIYNDDYILATGTANGTEQESLDKEKAIGLAQRSEEHTSELQSLMRISYSVFFFKKKLF